MITDMIETPESSNIARIGYDNDNKELRVDFKAGGSYLYSNVPSQLYENMVKAPSKGKFFHSSIKNVFKFTKLN